VLDSKREVNLIAGAWSGSFGGGWNALIKDWNKLHK